MALAKHRDMNDNGYVSVINSAGAGLHLSRRPLFISLLHNDELSIIGGTAYLYSAYRHHHQPPPQLRIYVCMMMAGAAHHRDDGIIIIHGPADYIQDDG